MKGYRGHCKVCGNAHRLLANGDVASHKVRGVVCEGSAHPPRSGSQYCGQCKTRVGQGFAHKMDCNEPKSSCGLDTR